jgi:uncharacterized membrane protein
MIVLLSGLFLFFGIHLLPTQPNVREGIRKNIGVGGYMAIFNIVSLLSFVMIVIGYGQMQGAPTRINPQLWVSPPWARHITFLLMIPAFILLAAAYVPSRIRDAAKHPMLASIKLWAFAHLLVRGDLAGVLLFGSFLAYGIYDRISVKNRVALGPLGTRKGTLRGDIIAVVLGLAAYAFMLLWGHAYLIGKPLLRVAA